jgi:protein ImuA
MGALSLASLPAPVASAVPEARAHEEPPLRRKPAAGAEAVPSSAASPRQPETLHPALWLGHQLGRHGEQVIPSGFAPLDAQLPGGGWPRRVLSELLVPHAGVGEVRLLSPSLCAVQQTGRLVMLFDPPQQLSAWALAQLGFDVAQLLVIHTRCKVVAGTDSLWALEQALKSGHVGAVVAWLPPRLRAERLRRLQLAAHAHDGPAFVLREMAAEQRPTAAPLRLALKPGGPDVLSLRLLKRRGPPLEMPLSLPLPPVLSATARLRARQGAEGASAAVEGRADAPSTLHEATFVNLA